MIETPVENLPPVVNNAVIPAPARPYCDIWGNIKKEPLKAIVESHKGDFINVYIYEIEAAFYYGFQLKLRKLIYQKEANVINDTAQNSADAALYCARRDLVSLVNNYSKKLVETFLTFDKICYNQPELF